MSPGRNGDGRVVVTGMGMMSPLGHTVAESWDRLVLGTSGVGCVTRFDAGNFTTRIAAEVKGFAPEDYMDRKDAKRNDRFVQLGIAAAKEAVANAGLDWNVVDPDRVGVIIGSGIPRLHTLKPPPHTHPQ